MGGGETGRGKCSPDCQTSKRGFVLSPVLLIFYCSNFRRMTWLQYAFVHTCLVTESLARKDGGEKGCKCSLVLISDSGHRLLSFFPILCLNSASIPRDKPGQDTAQGSTCVVDLGSFYSSLPPPFGFRLSLFYITSIQTPDIYTISILW